MIDLSLSAEQIALVRRLEESVPGPDNPPTQSAYYEDQPQDSERIRATIEAPTKAALRQGQDRLPAYDYVLTTHTLEERQAVEDLKFKLAQARLEEQVVRAGTTKQQYSNAYREGFQDGQATAIPGYANGLTPPGINLATKSTAPLPALAYQVCDVLADALETLGQLYPSGHQKAAERPVYPPGLRDRLEAALALAEQVRQRATNVVAEVESL